MQPNLVEGFDLAVVRARTAREALHAEIEAIKVAKADIYQLRRRSEVHAGADARACCRRATPKRAAS